MIENEKMRLCQSLQFSYKAALKIIQICEIFFSAQIKELASSPSNTSNSTCIDKNETSSERKKQPTSDKNSMTFTKAVATKRKREGGIVTT